MRDHTELELKLHVPSARLAAVRRALAGATLQRLELHAIYYDTPKRDLARRGAGLRLRRSRTLDAQGKPERGNAARWTQTLKTGGAGALERGEHEVTIDSRTPAVPHPRFARHADWAPAQALAADIGAEALSNLQARYEVRVRRSTKRIQHGGATIELALDEGEILAGGTRLPLRELELELIDGPSAPLYALARQWAERHGLWLDLRSKAERGDMLAEGRRAAPPATATRVRLGPAPLAADAPALLRRMLANALAQLLANQAPIAAGVAEHEHLHQLRVALRRLRSLLKLFGERLAAEDGKAADLAADWEARLRAAFGRTGSARDRDAVAADVLPLVQPALADAGLPALELPPATPDDDADDDAGALCREAAFSALLLELLAWADGDDAALASTADPQADGAAEGEHAAARHMRQRLRKLLRGMGEEARGFLDADIDARHRTRKRLKRLRYGLEFAADLFEPKALKGLLAELRRAQEALGHYNDTLVAVPVIQSCAASQPASAAFALGWLSCRREQALHAAAMALAQFADAARLPPLALDPRARKPKRGGKAGKAPLDAKPAGAA